MLVKLVGICMAHSYLTLRGKRRALPLDHLNSFNRKFRIKILFTATALTLIST